MFAAPPPYACMLLRRFTCQTIARQTIADVLSLSPPKHTHSVLLPHVFFMRAANAWHRFRGELDIVRSALDAESSKVGQAPTSQLRLCLLQPVTALHPPPPFFAPHRLHTIVLSPLSWRVSACLSALPSPLHQLSTIIFRRFAAVCQCCLVMFWRILMQCTAGVFR